MANGPSMLAPAPCLPPPRVAQQRTHQAPSPPHALTLYTMPPQETAVEGEEVPEAVFVKEVEAGSNAALRCTVVKYGTGGVSKQLVARHEVVKFVGQQAAKAMAAAAAAAEVAAAEAAEAKESGNVPAADEEEAAEAKEEAAAEVAAVEAKSEASEEDEAASPKDAAPASAAEVEKEEGA